MELYNNGQLGCFYHAGNGGMACTINSVFDTGFDEEKGVMKVDSVVRYVGEKTTLAFDDNTKTTNPSVGKLAAQASNNNNLHGVYDDLRTAMNNGTVLKDANIENEQYAWNIYPANVENRASSSDVDLYTNYKRISKENTSENLVETGEEVTINNKSYTIVGPFKITFGGKDITKVTAGNATWISSSKDAIYWSESKSNSSSDWSNDFNEKTSSNYKLNNKKFYLAVETSKLPSDGNYEITMEQEKFEYHKARIIVCSGNWQQQTGMYCYDNNPTPVEGKANWEVKRNPTDKPLKIIKKDKDTGVKLENAGFKIYAVLNNGTKGWVSGSIDADKTYGSDATVYPSDTEIKKLKVGTYYVYETQAPKGYQLSEQENFKTGQPQDIPTPTGDWVYNGEKKVAASKDSVTYTVENDKAVKPLEITKVDSKTGAELKGAEFKIYAVLDKALSDGTKEGWVSGTVSGEKEYKNNVNDAGKYEAKQQIENLHYGKYYIYETKAPSQDGYNLKDQEGYHQKATGSDALTGDWVYLDETTINKESSNPVPVTVENNKPEYGKLKIYKIDAQTEQKLSDGEFKIYAVLNNGTKGWVSDSNSESTTAIKTYETDASKASIYQANKDIEKLKAGKYYIFETKAPEGYNMKKQKGYQKTDKDIPTIKPSDEEWVYLGNKEVTEGSEEAEVQTFTGKNQKVVDKLEGYVWKDVPDTKGNKADDVYKEGTNDKLLEGIEVTLYDNNKQAIATAVTDKNGYYSFTTKNAPTYTGEDKNLYYWELAKGYVEFTYDNKEYICVDVFAGDDTKINSKAQEYTMTIDELDDNNLTGTTGANPGKATTYQLTGDINYDKILQNNKLISEKISKNQATYNDLKETPLTGYYDNKTYTISNINLGLTEKAETDFSVDETIAYMKVRMNGYTYTYKYGKTPATNSEFVVTVNEQNSTKTFTGSIYPSDIAYNKVTGTDELKVYVIYEISVQNNTTTYIDDIYYEQKLYLESLENVYDTNRYVLCTDDNSDDRNSQDFKLWSDNNGTASYNLKDNNSAYKNGIKYGTPVSSFIQFRVKEEALQKILTGGLKYKDIESAPTTAKAKGYHEYLRTDNLWKHDDNVIAYAGYSKSKYATQNDNKEKYYVHKSLSDERKSSALYLRLSLSKARTISGKVFEDTPVKETLGNGIIDENEKNRANQVKVEILNADKQTVTELYKVNEDGTIVYENSNLPKAETTTTKGGTFTFEGVVPGYYYIRFTYGDGTQKLVDASENEVTGIKSNDYKSTIIDSSTDKGKIIQASMEADDKSIENAQQVLVKDYNNEDAKKLVEWYKYIDNNYSTAVDDLEQRKGLDKYVYAADGKVYDESGNEVAVGATNVNSYTPIIGISVENDKNNEGEEHKNIYDAFNFGIIKTTDTKIIPQKTISNIKLTDQTSAILVSADPKDKKASYVTALDQLGSMVKAEIDQNLIYGSELEATYKITITNESEKDYVEPEESKYFGYYYKYGQKIDGVTQEKGVKIKEVTDTIDAQYNKKSINIKAYYIGTTETTSSGIKIEEDPETKVTNPDGSITKTNTLKISGWSDEIKSKESQTVEYTASALLSSDNEDDDGIINDAQVSKIGLSKLTPLSSHSKWDDEVKTTITITPPTGEDKTHTYWIAGAIALVALGAGIVILKKKVLK